MNNDYSVIIGLEIHAELSTDTKMFCRCNNDPFAAQPNEYICPVCFGLPGALPVPNEEAIRRTYLVGQALGSRLSERVKFDRKNYFYPDLPKGYQISQYDRPIASGGSLPVDGTDVRLTRLHLEEDTGKLSHISDGSLVDYNRSGVPLMELVTAPVIASAAQAKAFCEQYQVLLRTLKVATADMEKGEMRCEANVSVQPAGSFRIAGDDVMAEGESKLSAKVEIKNLNSFKSVERAITYEVARQIELIEGSGTVEQETRGWDEAKQKTVRQRGKESAHDYRYFPEPDVPEVLSVEYHGQELPELPWQRHSRYTDKLGLSAEEARMFAVDPRKAAYLEAAVQAGGRPATVANILQNRLKGSTCLPAEVVGQLAAKIDTGTISMAALNHLLSALQAGQTLDQALARGDQSLDLSVIVQEALQQLPGEVAAYKAGRTQVTNVFLGAIMKKTRGQIDPAATQEEIRRQLDAL